MIGGAVGGWEKDIVQGLGRGRVLGVVYFCVFLLDRQEPKAGHARDAMLLIRSERQSGSEWRSWVRKS